MKCGQNQSVEDAWSFKTCVKWFGDWKQELFLCTAEFGHIRYWICWLLCLALCIFQKQTAIFLNFALEAALVSAFPYLHHQIVCSLEELIWDFSWVIVELDIRISWFKLGTCFTIGCFRSGNVNHLQVWFSVSNVNLQLLSVCLIHTHGTNSSQHFNAHCCHKYLMGLAIHCPANCGLGERIHAYLIEACSTWFNTTLHIFIYCFHVLQGW